MYTRREIIKRVAAIPLVLSARSLLAAEESLKDRIARTIKEYSEQGIHRSGTDGDLENATWLSGRIRSLGLGPELDTFPFKRICSLECTLAIVVLTDEGMPPGIAITNAEDFGSPFGPPTVQASNADARWIRNAAASGTEARVVAQCDYVDAKGINVGTTIRGKSPNLAPLVVMTPRSGWWSCATERGGIAAWLEMMRGISIGHSSWALAQRPSLGVILNP